MTKEEINEFIEDRFNTINKHFRKAIDNFESEDIRKFRTEIKNSRFSFIYSTWNQKMGFHTG